LVRAQDRGGEPAGFGVGEGHDSHHGSPYITNTFTYIGGSKWQSGAGNIYYDEANHGDITYYNCGGC